MKSKFCNIYILSLIFGLTIYISCANKDSKVSKVNDSEKKEILEKRDSINNKINTISDTLKGYKIKFNDFDLYIKSNEDPSAVEVEYKKLVSYNDYDGNIYEKRDTILINYGMDDSFTYGNEIQIFSKKKIKIISVKTSFIYGVNISFIDDIPGYEIINFSFTKELKINDDLFSVVDDTNRDNEWFSKNKPEIKIRAYEYIKEIIKNNREHYKDCCPEYLDDFEKFESKEFYSLTYDDLGATTYLSQVFIEIQGEKENGEKFTEYLLD